MATPSTATTEPAPVRDITSRNGRSPGRTSSGRSPEQELRRARRTAQTGAARGQRMLRSLVKLHRSVSETYEQKQSKHVQELSSATREALVNIGKPSAARYGVLIIVSLGVDVFISPLITAAWVTVIGGILATIALAIVMALFSRLLLGKRAKRTGEYRKELEGRIEQVQADIKDAQEDYEKFRRWARLASSRYPGISARVASVGTRLGRAAKNIRPVAKLFSWLARFFKHPVVKQGGEAIPAVQIIPFWTLGAVGAYVAHRSEYNEAQRLLKDYTEGKAVVTSINDDMYQTQLAVIENELIEETSAAKSDTLVPVAS